MIGEHIDAYDSPEDATAGAADALSPSSVRCWFDCAFKWYGRYVMQWPDEPTSALSIGIATHEAVGENFLQKLQSKIDLPVEGVVALFRQAWDRLLKWTAFRDDEDPKALGQMGEGLVRKYISERAPAIQPAAVEEWLRGTIGGVRINARSDLRDINGVLVETKTMGAKRKASSMHRFQVATYRKLDPKASGLVQLDGLVKSKAAALTHEPWEVTAEDLRLAEQIYPMVQESARTGLFPPNRFSLLCSRRQCPYARQCMKEWGGEVPY